MMTEVIPRYKENRLVMTGVVIEEMPGLKLQDEATKGGPVGNALPPLGAPVILRSGGGETVGHVAIVAPAASARLVRIR